jgi:hypothetical protein
MKTGHFITLGLAVLLPAITLSAGTTTNDFSGVNKPVPDDLIAGVSDTETLSGLGTSIMNIEVSLDLQGGPAFNGDYYVSLSHGNTLAVLLNRPGRTASSSFGYSDNGYNVTFDDAAPHGDIHQYRQALFGNQTTPVDPSYVQPLTGLWAPDGRNVAPSLSYDTIARTALLSGFDGQDPNGNWTLFLTDASSGGTAVLTDWKLIVTGVPEPTTICMFALGAGLLAATSLRKRKT